MELTFRSHHQPLDESFKTYAQRKLDRLGRYLPTVREVAVELRKENVRAAAERFRVQVTVNSNGTYLRAEERAADPRQALDLAADALGRQVVRLKDRTYRSGHADRRSRATVRDLAPDDATELAEDEEGLVLGRVVREKRFPIQVMSVEEAVEQMELLSHTFFLFHDGDAGGYALLYRRRDGDYGLIRPEK